MSDIKFIEVEELLKERGKIVPVEVPRIEIKEGALVKAWNDNPDNFILGHYSSKGYNSMWHFVSFNYDGDMGFENVIEIPPDLAAQLEALGVK
jgi:hypothetical protein